MERQIGGVNYRIGKLDARKQFHVVRRLVPAFVSMAPLAELAPDAKAAKGAKAPAIPPINLAEVLKRIGPLSEALAHMPDADVDYVIDTCLVAVEREVGDGRGWVRVVTPSGGLMFEDLDMGGMMELVMAVVQENLDGFFAAVRSRVQAPDSQAA